MILFTHRFANHPLFRRMQIRHAKLDRFLVEQLKGKIDDFIRLLIAAALDILIPFCTGQILHRAVD